MTGLRGQMKASLVVFVQRVDVLARGKQALDFFCIAALGCNVQGSHGDLIQ
jgi:hypothetical protein